MVAYFRAETYQNKWVCSKSWPKPSESTDSNDTQRGREKRIGSNSTSPASRETHWVPRNWWIIICPTKNGTIFWGVPPEKKWYHVFQQVAPKWTFYDLSLTSRWPDALCVPLRIKRWKDGWFPVVSWRFCHSPNSFLVGGAPTPLKNDGVKVSWDDDSQYMDK